MTTDQRAAGGASIAVVIPKPTDELVQLCADVGANMPLMHDARELVVGASWGVDVVLVAVDADLSGLRTVAAVHRRWPELPIVVLCELARTEQFFDFLMAGAVGFCAPPHGVGALNRTIDAVLEDGVAIPRTLVRPLVDVVRLGKGHTIARAQGAEIVVTRREWEVLLLMRQHRTTREIADELFVSTATVRSHISSVVRKLGARDREEALELLEAE
jgi:DNA-binding NarL/FixJ family response regulator